MAHGIFLPHILNEETLIETNRAHSISPLGGNGSIVLADEGPSQVSQGHDHRFAISIRAWHEQELELVCDVGRIKEWSRRNPEWSKSSVTGPIEDPTTRLNRLPRVRLWTDKVGRGELALVVHF